jgi:hypothetical protein
MDSSGLPQTLHGYARGHRLLAHAGDLHESELNELDRLSDLSGYLPADATFDAYHTGFPCGRYYALACTWPDHDAPRRGTVLTHTLLVPRELWSGEADPFRWLSSHRRPADTDDTAPYRTLAVEPLCPGPSFTLTEPEMRGLLWLWFGQGERPLLWLAERPSLAAVQALWPWLWPESRATFAFCTFALQPRLINGRPFDLLGVPPAALGAFHELNASHAWWFNGGLRASAEPEPWLDELFARGPADLAATIQGWRDHGLGPPSSPGALRSAQRFRELADGARTRLPAARARLDLLLRVWPAIELNHPELVATVDQTLARLPEAPLEPRPLWDLQYLLALSPIRAHILARSSLGARILESLRSEVKARLQRAGGLAAAGLVALYHEAPLLAQAEIRVGIADACSTAVHAWADPLLDLAAQTRDDPLTQLLWANLPAELLAAWLSRWLASPTHETAALRARAADLAIERRSPELAFAAWCDDRSKGLSAAAEVVESHPSTRSNFEALLRSQPEATQLEWCLDCSVEPLRDLACRTGADILATHKSPVATLATRCDGRALGAPIFARVCPWTAEHELATIFARHPALTSGLVRLALAEPARGSFVTLAAIKLAAATSLWDPSLRAALTPHPARILGEGRDVLVQRLLFDIASGNLESHEAGAWLATSVVSGWLEAASPWEIERPFLSRQPGALGRLIAAVARSGGEAARFGPARCLALLLAHAQSDEIGRNIDKLAELLNERGLSESGGLLVRAELLGAFRIGPPPDAWRLAEICFYPVYRAVVTGSAGVTRTTWWASTTPDRPRYWRHWLLDTWSQRRWPLDAFIKCIHDDSELAERLFKRAFKQSSTRALFYALDPHVRRRPGLLRVWRSAAGS